MLRGGSQAKLSTKRAHRPNLWITGPDILETDEVETTRGRYDRGLVADRVTPDPPPRFAHASEAELARIFDFYGVAWRYEPDVFPISWNADGEVIESFAPDFYLPENHGEENWQATQHRLEHSVQQMTAGIRSFPEDKLYEVFPGTEHQAVYYFHGLIEHAAYHLGQIVLLAKYS